MFFYAEVEDGDEFTVVLPPEMAVVQDNYFCFKDVYALRVRPHGTHKTGRSSAKVPSEGKYTNSLEINR